MMGVKTKSERESITWRERISAKTGTHEEGVSVHAREGVSGHKLGIQTGRLEGACPYTTVNLDRTGHKQATT